MTSLEKCYLAPKILLRTILLWLNLMIELQERTITMESLILAQDER